jgi:hypothetical protein
MKALRKAYDKSENDLKALQSVGQIIGELLRQLDEERCALSSLPHVSPLTPSPRALLQTL